MLHVLEPVIDVVAASTQAATNEMTAWKAALLGLVEGITEYLPISSTGHLLVTQELLGIGQTSATKDAADTYAITIQAGAILAVLVLYWRRLVGMTLGAVGRRIQHHFDRAWTADEARATHLVVIGQKGLDRAAIEAGLAEVLG